MVETKGQRYAKTSKGIITQLLRSAKKRAKSNNRENSLTREWLEKKLKTGICEVTGAKFSYNKKEKYRSAPFAPSLDRIDSTKGYTPENTQLVCNYYNICKWQWDKQDLKKILKFLKTVKL